MTLQCNKFHKIEKCRVCGNEHYEVVLDLGEQYLSGIFPKEIDPETKSKKIEKNQKNQKNLKNKKIIFFCF